MSDPIELSELKERLQHDWRERDALIEEMRRLRFMEVQPEVPANMEPEIVQTPVGHQIVERMTGALTANPIGIHVPPADETQKAREQSSTMERFLAPAVDVLQKQADMDVVDRFIESLVADGHGCLRMLYAPQLWRGYPRKSKDEDDAEYNKRSELWKKGRNLPIAWNWIDPLTVYPLWGEFGLHGILELGERDLLTLNPDKWNVQKPDLEHLSRLNRRKGNSVEFAQWWTPETLTYYVEGEVVHHQKHKYGTPPYVYAFGLGAASTDTRYMGMSCLWPIRHLLPYLDRLLSQKATAIRMWCWPTVVFRQTGLQALVSSGEGEIPLREVEIAPGGTVTIHQDEEITFLTWQGSGPEINDHLATVMNMIERAGLADAMYGQSKGDSGYALNQLIAAARMRFKPIIAHAERALELQMQTLCDIIEHQCKQRLYVYPHKTKGWVSLGPDDLRGYRNIRVTLSPVMPTDTYARSSQAINEVNAGLRSRESAMEMIDIPQPDEEMRKILLDKWKADPKVQEWLTQQAIEKAGIMLSKGDMTMGQIQKQMPNLPPGLQGAIQNRLNAAAPPGRTTQDLGMAGGPPGMPPGGPPGMPQGMPAGGPPGMAQGMAGAQGMPAPGGGPPGGMGPGAPGAAPPPNLATMGQPTGPGGGPPIDMAQAQQVVQLLARQMGATEEQVIQWLQQQAAQLGISLQQLLTMLAARLLAGESRGAVAPGFRGAGPPVMAQPGARAAPAQHVGPVTRPSGIATGRAPGVRRRGMES